MEISIIIIMYHWCVYFIVQHHVFHLSPAKWKSGDIIFFAYWFIRLRDGIPQIKGRKIGDVDNDCRHFPRDVYRTCTGICWKFAKVRAFYGYCGCSSGSTMTSYTQWLALLGGADMLVLAAAESVTKRYFFDSNPNDILTISEIGYRIYHPIAHWLFCCSTSR